MLYRNMTLLNLIAGGILTLTLGSSAVVWLKDRPIDSAGSLGPVIPKPAGREIGSAALDAPVLPNTASYNSIDEKNLFRPERAKYVPPPPPPPPPPPRPNVPKPTLELFGVMILGNIKYAILDGTYTAFEEKETKRFVQVSGSATPVEETVKSVVPKQERIKNRKLKLGEEIGIYRLIDVRYDRVTLQNTDTPAETVELLLRDPNKPKHLGGVPPVKTPQEQPAPGLPAQQQNQPATQPQPSQPANVSGAKTGGNP